MRDEIILSASLDCAPRAEMFVREYSVRNGIVYKDKLAIVVDEIFSNIVSYAYKDKPENIKIVCNCSKKDGVFSITFVDTGVEYNPLEAPEPDVTLPLEKRQIGGLGIFIVKKFMDSLHYERKGNKNVLTLTKKL